MAAAVAATAAAWAVGTDVGVPLPRWLPRWLLLLLHGLPRSLVLLPLPGPNLAAWALPWVLLVLLLLLL